MDNLQKKWKMWYYSLDVNHDGTISIEDVNESRDKFTDLHKLLGKKAEDVKVDMAKWWNDYIFLKGKNQPISEVEFVTHLTNLYTADKAAFVERMQKCFDTIFDVIDTNKDRSIELQEFIFAFQAFGHENEKLVTKAFTLFGTELVPLHKIVSAWVRFVTSEDDGEDDVVKKAFDEGF